MPPPPSIPPAIIGASRRVVGPARVLGALTRTLSRVAAVAACIIWVAIVLGLDRATVPRVVVTLALLAALLVPAIWLHRATTTFRDLVQLPERLQSLRDGSPFTVTRADLSPARLRTGGIRKGVRTIRTTVREVADLVGPASTVAEVVAPTFWVGTAAAAAASLVLGLVAAVTLLVLVLR